MYTIDPLVWFANRKINFEPPHYIRAKTPINKESNQWIIEKLRGRYCYVNSTDLSWDQITVRDNKIPSFEDPAEAVFYELTWS
jgi:hypothetical protein